MSSNKLLKVAVLCTLLLLSHLVHSQDKIISGRVTDSKDGSGVAGVTVTPKGGTGGTQTDANGAFKITVAPSVSVLVFTSVGFTTQEISISGKTTINATLAGNISSLNEVVVIG